MNDQPARSLILEFFHHFVNTPGITADLRQATTGFAGKEQVQVHRFAQFPEDIAAAVTERIQPVLGQVYPHAPE